MRGHLITLEGIDGSGKSTVSGLLEARLKEAMPGRQFVFTAEPTAEEVGKILRKHLSLTTNCNEDTSQARRMEELFLFMADHAHHLSKVVIPALQKGHTVISDRYSDSTAAYQGVTLRGIVDDPVEWISGISRPWNIPPDRTIIFAIDPALALSRIKSRASAEKFERAEFLKEVDKNFHRLAEREPQRFVLVNADRETKDVTEEVLSLILEKI